MLSRSKGVGARDTDFRLSRRAACRVYLLGGCGGSRALRPVCASSRLVGRGFLGTACHYRLGALTRALFRPAGASLTSAPAPSRETWLAGLDYGQKMGGSSLSSHSRGRKEEGTGARKERGELEFAAHPLPEAFQTELSF